MRKVIFLSFFVIMSLIILIPDADAASMTFSSDTTISDNEIISNGQTWTINSDVTISSGVTVTIEDGGRINNYGTIQNNGIIENNEQILNYGTINNYATINNNNDSIINNYSTIENKVGGIINNDGTIENYNNQSIVSVGTINNNGTIINNNTITNWNYATINNYNTIENNGTINNYYGGDRIINYDCAEITGNLVTGKSPIVSGVCSVIPNNDPPASNPSSSVQAPNRTGFTPLYDLSNDLSLDVSYGSAIYENYLYVTSENLITGIDAVLHKVNIDDYSDTSIFTFEEIDSIINIAVDSNHIFVSSFSNENATYRYNINSHVNGHYSGGVIIETPDIPNQILLADDSKTLYVYADDYKYYKIDLTKNTFQPSVVYTLPNGVSTNYIAHGGIVEYNGMIYMTDKVNSLVLQYNPTTDKTETYLDLTEYTDSRFYNSLSFDSSGNLLVSCASASHLPVGLVSNAHTFCTEVLVFNMDKEVVERFDVVKPFQIFDMVYSPNDKVIYAVGLKGTGDFALGYYGEKQSSTSTDDPTKKKGNGTPPPPPTFGKDTNYKQIVENGFCFNGKCVDVVKYHTEFPLINATVGETSNITVKAYNPTGGANALKWIQIVLGMPEAGMPLNDGEVRNTFHLYRSEIEEVKIVDRQNLIGNYTVTTDIVQCSDSYSTECLELSFDFIPRDQLVNNVVAINVMNTIRASSTNYLNDGIEFHGESLNEPLISYVTASSGGVFYPQDRGIVELTLISYHDDLWQDEFGYLWTSDRYKSFVIISDIPVPIKEPDVMWQAMTRMNSNFADMIIFEQERAILVYPSEEAFADFKGSFAYEYPKTEVEKQTELDKRIAYEIKRITNQNLYKQDSNNNWSEWNKER